MRFVTAAGILQKARRFVSNGGSVRDEEVRDPQKLGEVIRQLQRQLAELEARTPPEAVEMEVNVGAGGSLTTLNHNLKGPIRWYVVQWTQVGGTAYPVSGPLLVQDATSTSVSLVLRSYVAGKAIVRVEPSFADVDPGVTVAPAAPPVVYPDSFNLVLAAQFNTTSLTAVNTPLVFTGQAGEVWDLAFNGQAGSSTTAGMRFAITAPASSTVDGMHYSNTTNITTRVYSQFAAINTLGTTVHTVAGGLRDDQIYVRVKLASTGTVGIQVAKVTSGTASVSIKSSLIATKVTEV